MVSFIIIPARKGFQAAAVTIVDPPKEEHADTGNEAPLNSAMEDMHVSETNGTTNGTANEAAGDAVGGEWGSGGW